jgi:hypothetical protein
MRNRISRNAGATAAAGLVVTALLTSGAILAAAPSPIDNVVLVNASRSMCGANALCPNAPAPDSGDQATAEQRIIDGYIAKQKGCTPDTPPDPQSVTWDPPGFSPNVGGTGNITDADPRLGGHFAADWVNGRWQIEYMYC